MNIVEMIARSHNGRGLDVVGEQFGLSREQTLAAIAELAPMVTSGVKKNTREPDGMVSLFEALSGGQHERYLDEDDAVQFGAAEHDGNAILGHVFGHKDVSREVAMQAAGTTGIGSAILKKMLPVIASMVMGAIFKRMTGGASAPEPRGGSGGGRSGGDLTDIIGDILGGGRQPQPRGGQGGSGLEDILGDILGGGSRQKRSPAPQPRQRGSAPGGGLDDLLRDILGGGTGGSGRGQRPSYNDDAIGRGRSTLDDILGGDTRTGSGNAADDLLDSVNRRLGY